LTTKAPTIPALPCAQISPRPPSLFSCLQSKTPLLVQF
jgi:hypothetical protein